jgi:hypothetical protein
VLGVSVVAAGIIANLVFAIALFTGQFAGTQWPPGSGYLVPPRNCPRSPHEVKRTSTKARIVGTHPNGAARMKGDIEIIHGQFAICFPGAQITHDCASSPTLVLGDYNGDKCTLLYGMTVQVDQYGQFVPLPGTENPE